MARDRSSERRERRRRHVLGLGGSFAGGLRRSLGLLAFVPIAGRAPQYSRLIFALVTDERIPRGRKAVLAGALGYLLLGRDLIPEDVPVLGGLDDLLVVVLAVDLFLDGVPRELLDEKLDELGIERRSFDRDIAQIRRLTPGPVRRALRRLPDVLDGAANAIGRAAVGTRIREWIEDGPRGEQRESGRARTRSWAPTAGRAPSGRRALTGRGSMEDSFG